MPQVLKGLADPVLDSQRSFRLILEAMSRPGTIVTLPGPAELPEGIDSAAATTLLTLCDHETPVWIAPGRTGQLAAWLAFHTSAPLATNPEQATFALVSGAADTPGLASFPRGDDRYPDRSATVIVECASFRSGPPVTLSGPGIEARASIAPSGLRSGFWRECADNHALFPLGVDILFVAGADVLALPRSISIVEEES